jgi:hypothetical protein
VLIPQMTVDLHGQRAPVPMAQPAAHGGHVHARFNAARGEQVALMPNSA